MNKSLRIYTSWDGMKKRCRNKNREGYKYYGEKGIDVAKEWLSFDVFYADMESSWFPGASIDRIDNDKGYSKANCRWATPTEQSHNSRQTKLTKESAAEIRRLYRTQNYSMARLGQQFGVSQGCVQKVVRGETWQDF
jgi:hypothetical protein